VEPYHVKSKVTASLNSRGGPCPWRVGIGMHGRRSEISEETFAAG
jgi:hypothetical protein